MFCNFFLSYIKTSDSNSVELTCYQKCRGVILNRAKDYYENDKERLREQAKDKCRNEQKKKKIKRENMEKTNTKICLKKKKQRLKKLC